MSFVCSTLSCTLLLHVVVARHFFFFTPNMIFVLKEVMYIVIWIIFVVLWYSLAL